MFHGIIIRPFSGRVAALPHHLQVGTESYQNGDTMKTYTIYLLTNRVNGKRYIGQTSNFVERIQAHKRAKNNVPIHHAIRKYGWDNFSVQIVSENLSIEDVDRFERYWIQHFETLSPKGYNLESGGNKNKVLSDETKRKMSKARMGIKSPKSESHRRKISEALTGTKDSPEVRQNKSKAHKGVSKTHSHVKNWVESRLGMPVLAYHIRINLFRRGGWNYSRISRETGNCPRVIKKYEEVVNAIRYAKV